MIPLTRREALTPFILGGAAIAGGRLALARESAPAPAATPSPAALSGGHVVVPLPFSAAKLKGLSERLITSHHDNNYAAAVRNLNRVEQDLAHMSGDMPPFMLAALRERELTFRNSKTLHEAYFANLGGDGRRSGRIEAALGSAYGSSARWEEHFRATGLGLGGGSGWVLLVLELDTHVLRIVSSTNHTQVLANALPLLVMDMYEHSYQMDFGASVARYIDAFFANVQWDEVNRRFERARRASALLRG
jgi:Fe-Mn family superoxide dismutase